MPVPHLSTQDIVHRLSGMPENPNYFAMYSSLYQGLVENSQWMILPLDDHMVHRGDGVFEAMKVVGNRVYLFDEHLARLERSAQAVGLKPYASTLELKSIIQETWDFAREKTKLDSGLLRVFMSRGQGSFSTNPYESTGTGFYVVATRLSPLSSNKYQVGAKVKRSQIPVKPSWLAQVKSCNYLPNVMQKKEAVDGAVDFVVSFDPNGYLAESSTENIVVLTRDGVLIKPKQDFILKGCTMTRAFELATELVKKNKIKAIETADISEATLKAAQEVMMLGTTLDVLPVTEYEGEAIGTGRVGEIAQALQELLLQDQRPG